MINRVADDVKAMDEKTAHDVITKMFHDLDTWQGIPGPFMTGSGSELRGDDYDWPPFSVSQVAWSGLQVAVDCLQAVRHHLDSKTNTKPRHFLFADMVLWRTALVGAAQAVWVLSPDDRVLRVERARTVVAYTQKQHANYLHALQDYAATPQANTDAVAAHVELRISELNALRAADGQVAPLNRQPGAAWAPRGLAPPPRRSAPSLPHLTRCRTQLQGCRLSESPYTVRIVTTPLFRQLVTPFARGLLDKAAALRELDLNKHQRARLGESLSTDIRKLCDILVPAARFPEVSKAAAAAAAGIGVDLRTQTWHSQPKFDPQRVVFHYEHMNPVAVLVAAIRNATDTTQIIDIIYEQLRQAWILKVEDKQLTALGLSHKRPDPLAAYEAAGIVLEPSLPDPGAPLTVQRDDRAAESADDIPEATVVAAEPGAEGDGPVDDLAPAAVSPYAQSNRPGVVEKPGVLQPPASAIQPGWVLVPAILSPCIGGLLRTWTDSGTQIWSVEDESRLVELLGTGLLARASVGDGRYREASMLHVNSGTLILQPRFPDRVEESKYQFAGSVLQLRPAGTPRTQLGAEFASALERAVAFCAASQGGLHVGPGGWDLSQTPYCLFARADGSPDWMIQTSPAPAASPEWVPYILPGSEIAEIGISPATEAIPTVAFMMAKACATWGLATWDLAFTYSVDRRP